MLFALPATTCGWGDAAELHRVAQLACNFAQLEQGKCPKTRDGIEALILEWGGECSLPPIGTQRTNSRDLLTR